MSMIPAVLLLGVWAGLLALVIWAFAGKRVRTKAAVPQKGMQPRKHVWSMPLQGIDSRIFLLDFYETSAVDMAEKINGRKDFEPNAYILCADGRCVYLTGAHVGDNRQSINPAEYEKPKGLDL